MSKQAFLVDDSKSARIVLSRMLKKSGFDGVEMAESGEEALERLQTLTPDAIFVDFLMEGIDGLETITEIKKDPRFDATPIVMCTANEGDEYVRAAVDHGALGIL
ncbi:MAG: response regulator, partial [Candidatus Thiodiazotropha endolucinida]|nr:response regulator [Candidatus Thiodiazotropha taylori]MCW4241265.1 response regulator [Candidatus Thiodiazotropha taylori]